MSTNDPLDPYPGNLKTHQVKKGPIAPLQILPLGTIMTNDPAGEYKREPLLSDAHRDENVPYRGPSAAASAFVWGVDFGRHFYEDKITKGELMVVKTISWSDFSERSPRYMSHNFCPGLAYVLIRDFKRRLLAFCPGCGARIIEKP